MGKLDAGYMETSYYLFHCSLTPVQGTQVQSHMPHATQQGQKIKKIKVESLKKKDLWKLQLLIWMKRH